MKEGKIKAGYSFNATLTFSVPESYRYDEKETKRIADGKRYGKVPGIGWYTTFELDKYNEELPLCGQYEGHEDEYPKYDNYDAIEVNQIRRIPRDYDGVMGVFGPTFFAKFNKEQFEIIGRSEDFAEPIIINQKTKKNPGRFYIQGQRKCERILIRRKNKEENGNS